jgi:hypothetical protein
LYSATMKHTAPWGLQGDAAAVSQQVCRTNTRTYSVPMICFFANPSLPFSSLHPGNTGTAVQRCSSSNPLCDTFADCCWGRYTKPSYPPAYTLLPFHRSIYLSVSTEQFLAFLHPCARNSFQCVCVCVCVRVHTCMHVCACMCVHVCLYACFCRYMGSVLGCRIFGRQWAAGLR